MMAGLQVNLDIFVLVYPQVLHVDGTACVRPTSVKMKYAFKKGVKNTTK
jgi:hypothetical protein